MTSLANLEIVARPQSRIAGFEQCNAIRCHALGGVIGRTTNPDRIGFNPGKRASPFRAIRLFHAYVEKKCPMRFERGIHLLKCGRQILGREHMGKTVKEAKCSVECPGCPETSHIFMKKCCLWHIPAGELQHWPGKIHSGKPITTLRERLGYRSRPAAELKDVSGRSKRV